MKALLVLGSCLALTAAVCACGTAGSARTTESVTTTRKPPLPPRGPTVKMTKAEIKRLPPLTMPKPSGPPPHELKVIDLRKGSGPGVPKHDWVTNKEEVYIRILQASYTGAKVGRLFGRIAISEVLLEGRAKGLRQGLTGMKVGGRRELIIPPKLAYPNWEPSWGYAPYVSIYVIDLVGMEPPRDRRIEYRNWPFGKRS
ncbi:MAG: FKBP-type peptidyl-prolyl cis-trans isomerase [Chloroflexota bacterium]